MSSPGGGDPSDLTIKAKLQVTADKEQIAAEVRDVAQTATRATEQVVVQRRGAGGRFAGAAPLTPKQARSMVQAEDKQTRSDTLRQQAAIRSDNYHQNVLSGQNQRKDLSARRRDKLDAFTSQRDSFSQNNKMRKLSTESSRIDSMAQDTTLRNEDRIQRGRNLVDRTAMSTMRAQGQLSRAPGYEQMRQANYEKAYGRFQSKQTLAGSMGMSMSRTMQSPLTYYAAAQGNFGPLLGGVGRGLFNAGMSSFAQYGAWRSMGGGMQAAGTAGPALPLSRLGSLAPAFGVAGAAAGVGAAYLGGSALFADIDQSNVGLAASMNSTRGGTAEGFGPGGFGWYGNQPNASGMYASLAGAASNYSQSVGTADTMANILGGQGVMSDQLNQQVQNTMALGAFSGIKASDLTDLTKQMAVGGGMSQEQVGQAYGKLVTQQQLTGVSINKMVDSLKSLEQVTGGVNVNVSGLAAAQKIMGNGINAGQATAPLLGATGVQSIQAAAVLGMSQAQFHSMQNSGNPAPLLDKVQSRLKSLVPSGGSMASRVSIAETLNNSLGLMDLSGASQKNQYDLFQKMLTGTPGQFTALANQIQNKTGSPSAGTFRSSGSRSASDSNSALTNALSILGSIEKTGLNAIHSDTSGMYRMMQGTSGNTGTPGGGGGGGHGGGTGSVTGMINRSTIPGQGTPESFSFTASQTAMIQQAAKKYGVPWKDLAAQVAREGGTWGSAAGGGIGQFQPGTAAGLANDKNSPVYGLPNFMANSKQSLMAMAYMDKGLYGQMGSWGQAFAAYNAGPGNAGVPAAQAYGQDVLSGAQSIQITGTMTLQDSTGHTIGTGTIDPSRTSVGKRGAHPGMPVPGQRAGYHPPNTRR